VSRFQGFKVSRFQGFKDLSVSKPFVAKTVKLGNLETLKLSHFAILPIAHSTNAGKCW
jgi:hypothetical protein